MATKPVINTISGGAVYSATRLNEIFDQLADAIEAGLGRGGVDESPNSMSANLDMDTNEIINVGDPTSPQAVATKTYADAVAANIDIDTATALDLLESIKTVDGSGSGLNSDFLDGKSSSESVVNLTIPVRSAAGDIAATTFTGDLTGDVVGDVKAADSTIVLDAGTDGTDATFTGDVTGDLTGNADTATLATTATKVGVLNVVVIDIGDWDMDASGSVSVAHGLDITKIMGASALVRNDANDTKAPLLAVPGSTSGISQGGIGVISTTTITIYRLDGGNFDDVTFSTTSYNRGWITVWYID